MNKKEIMRSLKVSQKTKDELDALGKKGDSYDDIISKLVKRGKDED